MKMNGFSKMIKFAIDFNFDNSADNSAEDLILKFITLKKGVLSFVTKRRKGPKIVIFGVTNSP